MRIKFIPSKVLVACRNQGHTDLLIESMTSRQLFTAFCEWQGVGVWGPQLYDLVVELSAAAVKDDREQHPNG